MNRRDNAQHEDAKSVSSRLRLGVLKLSRGETQQGARELAGTVAELLAAAQRRRADAVLRRLLEIPGLEGSMHGRLSETCFAAGLCDTAIGHAIRAAEAFSKQGGRRQALAVLEGAETWLGEAGPSAIESLASGWERCDEGSRAATLLVMAAEGRLAAGEWRAAVKLCERALGADPTLGRVHRTWGLALLALDDAGGATEHLAHWCAEAPGEIDSLVWRAEALWSLDRMEDTERALEPLVDRLGLASAGGPPWTGLGERVRTHLGRSDQAALAESRIAPFWEAEELVGPCALWLEPTATPVRGTSPKPESSVAPSGSDLPRVFLARDIHIFRRRLSQVLSDANLEVLVKGEQLEVVEALRRLSPPPDLLILPVQASAPSTLETLQSIHDTPELRGIPILGVTNLDASALDLDELRRLSVHGLIDKSGIPEQLVFRINQILRAPITSQRRFERAPIFMPVDVEVEGTICSEYALNLSCGGMLVTMAQPPALNTPARVRFRLPLAGDDFLEARGRVVRVFPPRDSSTPHHVALFFYPLEPRAQEAVQREVQTILASLTDAPRPLPTSAPRRS